MNNKTEFKTGDCVKCKTWGGVEFLGIFEYPHRNGSYCVIDVKTHIHYNIRNGDIQYASEHETKQIKELADINNIKVKEMPLILQQQENVVII